MNKYSFDGDSFFILKAAQDCVINGVSYVKNQPITFFEHCKPMLFYNKKSTNASSGSSRLLNYTEVHPNSLIINGVSKQESISNLIFTRNYDTIYTEEKVEEGTVDDNGKIYLTCSDEVKISNLFMYDDNGRLTDYQLEKNVLIVNSLLKDKTFKIFYTITHDKPPINTFNCTAAKIPYLSGSVITKGKINGMDGKMIIDFPKLSCSTTPTLNF